MILNKVSYSLCSRISCSKPLVLTAILNNKVALNQFSNTDNNCCYSSLSQRSLIIKSNFKLFSQNFRKMSSSDDEVLFEEKDCKGVITLNRPKALNTLNENMVHLMHGKLIEWQKDKKLVILKGMGEKSFCAGGDVVSITKGRKGDPTAVDFFKHEYTLDSLIGNYKAPFVSFISGIVMGGGCGVSINGKFRVASEKSLFAMPETAIGLFPDVGGSHFLPKLGGGLGMFLALTGHRLKGWDLVRAGLATHYCPKDKLDELHAALLSLPSSLQYEHVEALLDTFNVNDGEFSLTSHLKDIKECFTAPTVQDILLRLKENDNEFCRKQLLTLASVSPTSLVITFEQLKRGSQLSLQECLKMEYRMVQAIYQDNDFFEGVRARLVDKDNKPNWKPASLSEMNEKEVIERYFAKLPEEKELQL